MTGVFVCCAPKDEPFAERLADALRARAIDARRMTRLGTKLETDDHVAGDGFAAIKRADVVVFVLSCGALRYARLARALDYARSLSKPMVGVVVDDRLTSDSVDRRFRWLWALPLIQVGRDHHVAAPALEKYFRIRLKVEVPPRGKAEGHKQVLARAKVEAVERKARRDFRALKPRGRLYWSTWGNGGGGRVWAPSPDLPAANADELAVATQGTFATAKGIVDCSVFAPSACAPGSWLFVQVYFHKPRQAAYAAALAEEFDPGTTRRGFGGLQVAIPRDSVLDVELEMKGVRVDELIQRLVWRGRAEAVQFDLEIPARQKGGPLPGSVTVRRDGIPIGRVGFRVLVKRRPGNPLPTRQAEEPVPFRSAFISYASRDRDEVLRRVPVLQAARITFFQDLLSLDPGDRWKEEIYRHIDDSDLFLLFWSKSAKGSKWVRCEANRALELQSANRRHLPEIRPVILGRPVVLPWPELEHLHFDDRLIYLAGG